MPLPKIFPKADVAVVVVAEAAQAAIPVATAIAEKVAPAHNPLPHKKHKKCSVDFPATEHFFILNLPSLPYYSLLTLNFQL